MKWDECLVRKLAKKRRVDDAKSLIYEIVSLRNKLVKLLNEK